MVDIKSRLFNPLILSVFISILIIIPFRNSVSKKYHFNSLLESETIEFVKGFVESSPVKTGKGNYYSCDFRLIETCSKKIRCDASGLCRLFIPSAYVESFFPGKLYSLSSKKCFVEKGTFLCSKVTFSNGLFFSDEIIESSFNEKGFSYLSFLRAKGRLLLKRMMYSWGEAGGLFLALISGAREYLDPLISENFRLAGLSHILALSGMHLSLFSGIALFLGEKIGRKRITYILQLIILCLFVWFAGFSPSLMRAFICVLVIMVQKIIGLEKSDMLTVLCFSFFVQSSISPYDVTNYGFVLSYGALGGILIFSDFFKKLYGFILPKPIAASFAASTGAQLITMPFSLFSFGMITPIGIVSSVMVSPAVTFFIYSGLILVILGLIFPSFVGVGEIVMKIQYNLIVNLVGFFAKVPPFLLNGN